MNHPIGGTSINKIKSQAKIPEMRNTPLWPVWKFREGGE